MATDNAKLQLLIASISTLLTKVNTAINTRTAPDSEKLGGKTLVELQTELGQVTQAELDALSSALATFIARTDNPHAVSAAQVGLGNVLNAGFASQAQAEAGEAVDVYVNPLNVKQFITTWWADQVGTAPETLDTINEIADAITNNATAIEAIEAIAAGKETPAGAQAKVDAAVASLTTLIGTKLDATAQAVDSAKLEGQTLAQVLATAAAAVPEVDLSGKLDVGAQAADSALLQGKTAAQIVTDAQTAIAPAIALKLDATAKAVDSDKLDGKTFAEVQTAILAAVPPVDVSALEAADANLQTQVNAVSLQAGANATAITELGGTVDEIMDELKAAFDDGAALFEEPAA